VSAVDLGTYYANAKGKKGEALKTALAGIIYKSSAAVSYANLKTAYTKTDVRSDGYLYDVYSNTTSYTPGSSFASSYSAEGDGYNREHTIPQSIFSKASPMVSDLFHVYPSDAKMNGVRSNYCHGEVGTITTASNNNFCYLGTPNSTITADGCTETYVFEPNDEYKGDFARTYFYFVTCYQTKLTSFSDYGMFSGDTYPSLTTWAKNMLLRWAENDPVSTKETTRNEAVYNYPSSGSNNRNPFIDFPGLEQYIWGDYTDVAFDPDNYTDPFGSSSSDPSISLNKSTASVTVGSTLALTATVSNASGATVTWTTSNSSVATVSSGTVTGVAAGTTTITASITVSGTTYSATCTVTVTESGSSTGGDGDYYVKVTSSDDLTSGQYLIVYETGNLAYDGSSTSLNSQNTSISVSPSNSQIEVTSTTEAAEFTIDTSAGTIKSASGYYIGQTSNSNGVLSSTSTAYTNTISVASSGDATIVSSGGAYFRYNTSGYFRYYKSSSYSSQQAVQLYKKETSSSSSPVDPTISFSTTSMSKEVGDTWTQAVTTNSDGAVTYSSSDTDVVTVNSSTGAVTAVAAGTATITANVAATSTYNAGSATYSVTVSRKTQTVTFSSSSVSVTKGSTLTNVASTTGDGTITYTSSDTSVATVNSSGVITGVAAGTTTITVTAAQTTTYDEATATCTVTVTEATVPSISLDKSTAEVEVSGTTTLTATKTNASSSTIYWTSSNTSVVSVSSTTGNSVTVTGVSAGTATVTAYITVSGTQYSADCSVTVTSSGGSSTGEDYYAKVASSSDLASGQYLIVYETGNLAFNGGLTTLDAVGNTISVSISNSQIPVSSTTEAAEFTIDISAGTIKSASGYYIGETSEANGLLTSTSTVYTNSITYNSGDIDIQSSGGPYLRYNSGTNNGTRFRYYKSSTYTNQNAIQLYKRVSSDSGTSLADPTVSFATATKTLEVGDTYTQAVTTNSDGTVTYSSDATTVATVNSSTGLVTALTAGTAVITANVSASSSYNAASATYTVTVVRKTPTLTFATSSEALTVGGTCTQTATYSGDGSVTYSSSDTSVATVDNATGEVTAVGAGTTVITATAEQTTTYSSAIATYTVTVSRNAQTISFANASLTVAEGSTASNVATTTGDGTITYSSSDTGVATVDSEGTVTGVSEGTATITATAAQTTAYASATASYTVTVTESGYSYYVKVTTAPSDWSGEYLIVYEDGLKAMDGGATQLNTAGNSIDVAITHDRIPATETTKAAAFTIADYSSGYSIMSKSGYYIGATSNNSTLASSTSTAYANSLSLSDNLVSISCSYSSWWSTTTTYLCYYDYSSSSRFRYYSSITGNYKPLALYKRIKLDYQICDVDMDGDIDTDDVTALVDYLDGTRSSSTISLSAADINNSGTVSLSDLTELIELLNQ